MKHLTTKEAAKLLSISERRVRAKITQGHFPKAKRCGCEKQNWLIPESEIKSKQEKET